MDRSQTCGESVCLQVTIGAIRRSAFAFIGIFLGACFGLVYYPFSSLLVSPGGRSEQGRRAVLLYGQ